MTKSYRLSPLAEQDIDDIINYIGKESQKTAHDFLDVLYKAFNTIVDNPYIGHLREEITNHL